MLLISLVVLALVLKSTHALEPFHSIKAINEKIQNYEVIQPIVRHVKSSDNQVYPRHMEIEVFSSTEHFHLRFHQNENFVGPNFASMTVNENHKMVQEEISYPNCYYLGTVDGHPNWTASMAACHGLQVEFGCTMNRERRYHVEPLDSEDTRWDQPHALYREAEYSAVRNRKYGCRDARHAMDEMKHLVPGNLHGRVRRASDVYYIEWIGINDHAQFLAFGSNLTRTVQRILTIANEVNNIYIKEYKIRVVLLKVITFTTIEEFPTPINATDLLDSLERYAVDSNGLLNEHRDTIMLMTGLSFSSAAGLANTGSICDRRLSVAWNQDAGGQLGHVIATVAHELGHVLNMKHDDDRGRVCNCPDAFCIMYSESPDVPPTRFSSCGLTDMNMIRGRLDSCLLNVPTQKYSSPTCGDGIVEGQEQCDCGEPGVCSNPCCNAATCRLISGAQCALGRCCDLSTCKIKPSGTECRPKAGECDLAETCSGASTECPPNAGAINGVPCGSGAGYCYNMMCHTHRDQCMKAWNSVEGPSSCYNLNKIGDGGGNCGKNTSFISCASSNVLCGLLQCLGGNYTDIYGVDGYENSPTVPEGTCSSFEVADQSPGTANPSLVQDGTKCGTDMICISQQCRPLSAIPSVTCPKGSNGLTCSGNTRGVCNNLGKCSCVSGYQGTACEKRI